MRHRRSILRLIELESRTVPTLLGQQLFPSDNPFNQRIADAPVASNSGAILQNIISRSGDGRLHPDFGQNDRAAQDLFGIPINIVHGNSVPKTSVIIDDFADESDIAPVPIPNNPILEGDFQNGPRFGVDERGDSHLIIWDVDNNIAYEFFRASRPNENSDGQWHADQQSIWDLKTNTFRTLGFTSADAAGLPILPGLVRPDEALPVDQGGQGVINHAIRFTLQNAIILNEFLYPASHVANRGNTNADIQPPMGARFRLKAGVDVSQLNPQTRIVAQAMKDYGMIVADNGSNFFFSGASYSVDDGNQFSLTWNDDDIQDTRKGLKSLRFSDFEVVDLTPTITAISSNGGVVGETITIAGRNFSGSAGRLQVFFGDVPASSVTFIDDTRISVVVPAGTGSVPIRVQSGVATNEDSNFNGSIFGYGISAITSNAMFTYGAANTAPPLSPSTIPPPITVPVVPPVTPRPNLTTPFVVGGGAGVSVVSVFDANGQLLYSLTPFNPSEVPGGIRTAIADVTGDGVPDVIVGIGPGGVPRVKVFDGVSRQEILSMDAFESNFRGGVYVAAGDVNGDGRADLIITPDEGGGPRVRIISGNGFVQLADFYGIDDANFGGGARAATGDINNDGRIDLLIAAGFGGGPRLAGFDGLTLQTDRRKLFNDFFVFEQTLRNGIFLASGDINGDGFADVIAGGGPGGGPRIFALSGKDIGSTQSTLANFFAGDAANRGGVRVVVKNLDGDAFADLVVASGTDSAPMVTRYAGKSIPREGTPDAMGTTSAFAMDYRGGVFVG